MGASRGGRRRQECRRSQRKRAFIGPPQAPGLLRVAGAEGGLQFPKHRKNRVEFRRRLLFADGGVEDLAYVFVLY